MSDRMIGKQQLAMRIFTCDSRNIFPREISHLIRIGWYQFERHVAFQPADEPNVLVIDIR